MVPCSFEIKMLSLAIRIHTSSTLSVTTFISDHVLVTARNNKFFWKNYISTMCEVAKKPSQHIKPVFLDFGNRCIKVSSESLQKTHTGESTSRRWKRKQPVGSKFYNNWYWNYLRQVSCVVLRNLSKVAFVWTSVASILLHFSIHFGVLLFLTRHVSLSLALYKFVHIDASPMTIFSFTSRPNLLL